MKTDSMIQTKAVNASTDTLCDVFVRDWWREAGPGDGRWPDNLVPLAGAPRHYIARDVTEEEAREICAEYNDSHKPGRYSRKAEFERA